MKAGKIITLLIVGITAISLVGLSGLFSLGGNSSNNNQSNTNEDGGVPCLTSEVFHIHPALEIIVDGKKESVPGNIGVLPGCTREIHTHEANGIIHIEAAVDRGYTFADWMSVWGKPLLRDGYTLKVTVDGKEITDLYFVLKDGQQIVLQYTKR